ncbi:hypothetical protein [Xanthomonas dyei]|uniref:hypothetical protein n=1 Tax=Xanthomonas dyei TaxID=743699 RepID=UPI001EE80F41|nr:hypothetical protein [Xanthomonas dyei]
MTLQKMHACNRLMLLFQHAAIGEKAGSRAALDGRLLASWRDAEWPITFTIRCYAMSESSIFH